VELELTACVGVGPICGFAKTDSSDCARGHCVWCDFDHIFQFILSIGVS
jgi:hypothetical protein